MNLDATAIANPQHHLLHAFWQGLGGPADHLDQIEFSGDEELASVFEVSSFAAASVASLGLAVASLRRAQGQVHAAGPAVRVDRRLTAMWFDSSIRPQGWSLPSKWDAIAGDYRGADGWIRLHTNAPQHRTAALAVLKVGAEREAVAKAVATWPCDVLEAAVVAQGGCAATMRSWSQWQQHRQGQAVLSEPLLDWRQGQLASRVDWDFTPQRPLHGLRVLDMTRVLAGPVATRSLASLGAEVLRIDPPWWDEPALAPEITLGKRCARLDLRDAADRRRWESLLQGADVLVHGYRRSALENLGLGAQWCQHMRPGLIDVSLNAYGFTGPWADRRGFDSVVQMSMGIAHAGQCAVDGESPVPLPVQALDHATGYLLAAAVVRGLEQRLRSGRGCSVRASLARTGALLMEVPRAPSDQPLPWAPESQQDWATAIESTAWGPAYRLSWPLEVAGVQSGRQHPATKLGSAQASWA